MTVYGCTPPVDDRDGNIKLPIEPLARWLREQTDRDPTCVVARRLGMDESRIRSLRDGQKTVRLDFVDRWFCELGNPMLLRELWPELFVWDEEVTDGTCKPDRLAA